MVNSDYTIRRLLKSDDNCQPNFEGASWERGEIICVILSKRKSRSMLISAGIFLILIALLVFLAKRRKLKGPLNEQEENYMPVHLKNTERNILVAYVYLAGWVIRKNSRDSTKKIDFIHAYFKEHFGKMNVEITGELTNALKFSTNIRSIAQWVGKRMPEGKDRLQLITFLIDLSFADGDIIDREYVAIARFADLAGINVRFVEREIYNRRKAIYENPEEAFNAFMPQGTFYRRRALFRLQLPGDASKDEIRRAYRKLASDYHPDRFETHSEEEKAEAAEKFRAIKEAYELLSGK